MKSSKHIESPALESFLISIFDSYMRRALNLCGWRRIDDPNVYFDELEEKTLRNQRRGCFDGSKFKNVLRHPTTVSDRAFRCFEKLPNRPGFRYFHPFCSE